MNFEKKIRLLSLLRDEILQIIERDDDIILKAYQNNNWFAPEFIQYALQSIAFMLEESKLIKWFSKYPTQKTKIKKIGLIMAGNIPMVGFHDLLCVLISGHRAEVKLSHNDDVLIPYIVFLLQKIDPGIREQIKFETQIDKPDAVIATGSDNTSRYFKYAFKDIRHIIRKNRTSCCILNGNESTNDFEALSEDIFTYFGLGCRNVSKIYLPKNFDVNKLVLRLEKFNWVKKYSKYYNNYTYRVSRNLLENKEFVNGHFFILSKSKNIVSPISCIYYEEYEDLEMLKHVISLNKNKLQCIVSKNGWYENSISFGMAQYPEPWDYADNIDTMKFLLNI